MTGCRKRIRDAAPAMANRLPPGRITRDDLVSVATAAAEEALAASIEHGTEELSGTLDRIAGRIEAEAKRDEANA